MLLDVRIIPLTAAITAIVINAGAYIAEIVRGSFLSIHRGLREAGLALGLPFWKVLVFVVGPLAFRRMIPALGNQFIVSLKDTSLFIVIGVGELTAGPGDHGLELPGGGNLVGGRGPLPRHERDPDARPSPHRERMRIL